jgi:membrane associated rhomboid family serine protease
VVTVTDPLAGSVRDRLLVALADPEVAGAAGRNAAALVAFREPMAVFEWLGTGKGLVLLDARGLPDGALSAELERVLAAHEKGLLFVVVAGGGDDVATVLREVDRRARNRDHLGLYLAEESGVVRHVVGRRLAELERAARALPATAPLSPDAVAAIVERGRRERLDAMEFVRSTAHRFPHVTVGIIAICTLLFALAAGHDLRAETLFSLLCNDPEAVARGQVWRVLSYALLHDPGNPTHLIVNMLSLYSLGGFLEPMLGRRRMATLCLVTAVAGGVASVVLTRAISVGASGVVWGLLGATLGLLGQRHRFFPALLARSLRQRLVVLLLINIAISFLPHIDRYCHFGGGLAGYLLARLFARRLAKPLT